MAKKTFEYGSTLDYEKNAYKTVAINSPTLGAQQEWMAENLNTSVFNNGDKIAQAASIEEWQSCIEQKIPAWCYYDNKEEFGKLYNIFAILDKRGIVPAGFQLPNYVDYTILGMNLQEYEPVPRCVNNADGGRVTDSGVSSVGLKLMGKKSWKKKGLDLVGFDAKAGGYRAATNNFHDFIELEKETRFWMLPHGLFVNTGEQDAQFPELLKENWYEYAVYKMVFPENEIAHDATFLNLFNRTQDKSLQISKEAEEKLASYKISMLNNSDRLAYYQKYFPIKKAETTREQYFRLALEELDNFSSKRSGMRFCSFINGKDNMYFPLVELNQGAYIRAFRYI